MFFYGPLFFTQIAELRKLCSLAKGLQDWNGGSFSDSVPIYIERKLKLSKTSRSGNQYLHTSIGSHNQNDSLVVCSTISLVWFAVIAFFSHLKSHPASLNLSQKLNSSEVYSEISVHPSCRPPKGSVCNRS